MTITPITVLDVSQVSAALVAKYRSRYEDGASPYPDARIILLRGPKKPHPSLWKADVDQVDQPILKDWKGAKSLLVRIRNGAAQFFGGTVPELGRAYIESLKPGAAIDWHVDDSEYGTAHVRVHVALVPCPGAWLYSGTAAMCLPWGQLAVVEHRILNSAVNVGNWPRVHLVCDLRRPERDDPEIPMGDD